MPYRRHTGAWADTDVQGAKRRLYVIGDRTAWSQHRYFEAVAKQLTQPSEQGFPQ